MTLRTSNQLFDAYFTADSMAEVFCDQGRLQGMLDFEAALARAEAQVGLIPQAAVAPIAQACLASLYDVDALGEAIATAGNSFSLTLLYNFACHRAPASHPVYFRSDPCIFSSPPAPNILGRPWRSFI